MVGLALACGGASALNHVLDRDIDRLMGKRTRSRPVAAGRVPPSRALEFGLALSALSFVLLAIARERARPRVLALVGNLFYVLVYTRWLKRSTPQNIVIGGAAGAVPPLVGWAAATGHLAVPALVAVRDRLLLDAAALLGARAADQARLRERARPDAARRARRPRDGAPDRAATRSRWSAVDARAVRVRARSGSSYLVGGARARRALPRGSRGGSGANDARRARMLFHYSLAYLALLFVAMAVDPVV